MKRKGEGVLLGVGDGPSVGVSVGVGVGVMGVLVGMGGGVSVGGRVAWRVAVVGVGTAVAGGGVNVGGKVGAISATAARVGSTIVCGWQLISQPTHSMIRIHCQPLHFTFAILPVQIKFFRPYQVGRFPGRGAEL